MAEDAATPRRTKGTTPDTDRYRAILTAARQVFRRQGYNEATVEDLRRAAGVSRATFYFYFQDKREVLIRLLTERTGQFHELYTRRYPRTDDFTIIVLANVQYFAHYSRDNDIFLLLRGAMDDPTIRGIIEDVRSGFRRRLANKFIRLANHGLIQTSDPEQLARLLIGMVESYARHFFELYTTESEIQAHLAEAIRLVSETWYRALYTAEPPLAYPYEQVIADMDVPVPEPLVLMAG